MEYIIDKIEEQLGTSISTSMFSKDIGQMKSTYNAPINFHRLNKGYYYTEPDFSIREFPLTHEEIDALDYSTALLHQMKGTKIFQHFENAINKVIEGYRISSILGKSETQILQVEEPVHQENSNRLEVILKAIVSKQLLRISYKGFGKEEKVHRVSPYLLKEYRNRWYVIGYSDRVDKVLVLALDRIQQLSNDDGKFVSETDFVADDFFKYSFGITQVHEAIPEKIMISFTPKQANYIMSQPLHHSQRKIKEDENEMVIELRVYITAELKMSILSFGSEAVVLEPESLRNEIKETIEKMNEQYQ
jgi:predicted DNA-binding transcriptional regulator YafY